MTEHYDPPGLNFEANGRQMKYCYPDCPRESLRGWLLYKHPDGQWVTLRKATETDIAAINEAVVSAHHGEVYMEGTKELVDLSRWLEERRDNATRLGNQLMRTPEDRSAWAEDASYFQRAIAAVNLLARLRPEEIGPRWTPTFRIDFLRDESFLIEGRGEMRIHETEHSSVGRQGSVLMAPALRVYKGEFRSFEPAGRKALYEAYASRKRLIASMSEVNCEVMITGIGPKDPGTESVEFKLQSVSEPK